MKNSVLFIISIILIWRTSWSGNSIQYLKNIKAFRKNGKLFFRIYYEEQIKKLYNDIRPENGWSEESLACKRHEGGTIRKTHNCNSHSFSQFVPDMFIFTISVRSSKGNWKVRAFAAEFNTIAIDDGIAMGHNGMLYSLPSRELIADSVDICAMPTW